MIIELRTYTLRLGAMRDFLALYAAEGRDVQAAHLGAPVLYLSSEIGEQNQVIHAWRYRDHTDRDARRAALEADPRWLAYRTRSMQADQVRQQHNAIFREVDFAAFAPLLAARPAHPAQPIPNAPSA